MSKVQREAYFLHEGFRKYVSKSELSDYDNEFIKRNSYNVKFMIKHIEKYVDIKSHHKDLVDKNEIALFNFYLYDFSQRYTAYNVAFKEYKNSR